jgi:glutamyl-tRNA reductase
MALKGDVRQAIESWRADSTSPVGRLRQSVEQLRQEELRRLRQRHPEIPEATMEALTRSMVNRMFHHPVIRLKTLEPDLAASVADLFATPAAGSRE